jgi:uncharacterized protein (UPF0332 family)
VSSLNKNPELFFEFVVNENFNSEIAKFLSNIESERSKVDYGYIPKVTKSKALKDLKKAEIFVSECEKFL